MFRSKALVLSALIVAVMTCTAAANAAPASGQISVGIGRGGIGIGIGGPAPVCPYGYFDYAPYDCSPYGYYGPDWFDNGIFIGSGPWFHGRSNFYGHVDNRYDPRQGYRGPVPERGDRQFDHFRGNEGRDGRGHVGDAGHDAGHERALPGDRGNGRNNNGRRR